MIDRCELADRLHKEGYNCAQAVFGAFCDLTGYDMKEAAALSGGMGGGMGGSYVDVCGAISGGCMVLSLLFPFTDPSQQPVKLHLYELGKEFHSRFYKVFDHTRCGDLRAAKPGISEATPAAARLGLSRHCDIMIVTAVELLEQLLRENGKL